MKFDTFHSFRNLEPRSAWMSTNARHPASLHVRVTGNQQRSDKLTVKLISVVPWEVVGEQVVQRNSVMDLGQDSPVLSLHCHQSFCSRSICITEKSRTSFELLESPQDFYTLLVERNGSRCQGVSQEETRR